MVVIVGSGEDQIVAEKVPVEGGRYPATFLKDLIRAFESESKFHGDVEPTRDMITEAAGWELQNPMALGAPETSDPEPTTAPADTRGPADTTNQQEPASRGIEKQDMALLGVAAIVGYALLS